ncbi:MAG: phosphohistidine phosphatase SixA [Anaerolineales bacterium]|uniref:phosphohistidine phosphatase SixA n=1 Tax=Candidatus Villigracilis vicinus TaxID=3140679 RepID=UPI0031364CFE|nr:phosphohistidine phosphatase SixA [Anaerolineales bacterium]
MNLYLIRHAIAEEESSSGEDSQRALTDKGAKKMRQVAKGLKILGIEFDFILSSPYLRAYQTAEILGDVFKMKKKVVQSENLTPMGDPDLLLAEINEKYSVNSLAIVGHEPYLSTLVSLLVAGGAPVEMTFKKGGICHLSTDDLHHTHKATLEWLLTPGVMVEIAER